MIDSTIVRAPSHSVDAQKSWLQALGQFRAWLSAEWCLSADT
ncbi:hypothetical protein BSIN_0872 [Burkholderia singularis]|uniref:Uncharacterized protein n=1 Tax=Burkholderia singularis TaxID=1503053 RepID=A0A238HAT3_9BURK|nr:hypothetical protein BSIN_0872 [Burkholderia singularis]